MKYKTLGEFMRHATDEEKEAVYNDALDVAIQKQNEILKLTKDKEKMAVYESMFHALHFAQVAMNPERVGKLLDSISAWSYAHRQGNGELSDEEQQKLIERALKKMKDLV